MKNRSLVFILISISVVAVLIGGCSTTKKSLSKEDFFKTWSGTWVNTDVPGNALTPQKIVTHPDGTVDGYSAAENQTIAGTFTFTLLERWVDSDGNTCFKAQKTTVFDGSEMTAYEYGKISDSGDTYELIYHVGSEGIEDWEPENPLYNYIIYYRQ